VVRDALKLSRTNLTLIILQLHTRTAQVVREALKLPSRLADKVAALSTAAMTLIR
jgi:hypothetical protein